jgi:uncharacterized protein (DUF2147 family)
VTSPLVRALLALALVVAPAAAAGAAPAVEGDWLTDDGKGVVRIAACGRQMCGRIVRVLDRNPATPTTDVHNPDSSRRNQSILGLQVLWGFEPRTRAWEGGRAYDPKSGKSYRSSLRLNADGTLRVTGCVLFVCRSKRWTRSR